MNTHFRLTFTDISPIATKPASQVGTTLAEHGRDSVGRITIGPSCMVPEEIDRSIDSLVAELNRLRKTAKRKLTMERV